MILIHFAFCSHFLSHLALDPIRIADLAYFAAVINEHWLSLFVFGGAASVASGMAGVLLNARRGANPTGHIHRFVFRFVFLGIEQDCGREDNRAQLDVSFHLSTSERGSQAQQVT